MDQLENIRKIAAQIESATIMEICGGHTNVIMRYGLRDMLPKNIRLISGPGCPVCVSSQYDIDCMVELARKNIPIATYGDMLRVPGSVLSLEDARVDGARIIDIYSVTEVLDAVKRFPDLVFFGIGFETTAPMTAFLIENGVCVYSVHKLIPPALEVLCCGDVKIDGFLDPGHVTTIIGACAYSKINKPQVITGFTPEQILRAIGLLLIMIKDKRVDVVNGYPEGVRNGNKKAQLQMEKTFKVVDSEWRGLGVIPASGLEVKDPRLNAKVKYKSIISQVPRPKPSACRCGDVLRGAILPVDCPLYKKSCTPEHPYGACMVSSEGSCAISYRYGA